MGSNARPRAFAIEIVLDGVPCELPNVGAAQITEGAFGDDPNFIALAEFLNPQIGILACVARDYDRLRGVVRQQGEEINSLRRICEIQNRSLEKLVASLSGSDPTKEGDQGLRGEPGGSDGGNGSDGS